MSYSQDPFFLESRQIKAYINPAFTGFYGMFTAQAIHKEQWWLANPSFQTLGLNVEQSFPCLNIDFGFYYIRDREGQGFLVTDNITANFVYTVAGNAFGKFHNLRFGLAAQYVGKSIDWDHLVFSDQLDPRHYLTDGNGVSNATSFVPPDWDKSTQFNMGFGFIHKVVLGNRIYKYDLTWGAAAQNYVHLFDEQTYDSLLKLNSTKFNRYSAHASLELPVVNGFRNYIGFKPSLVWQKQSGLSYNEIGVEFNYQKAYSFGIFLHTNKYNDLRDDTKGVSYNAYLNVFKTRSHLVNLGLSYFQNIGGAANAFGQTFQISLTYHINRDGCGKPSMSGTGCPPVSLSHNILYENIWFSPVEGINK